MGKFSMPDNLKELNHILETKDLSEYVDIEESREHLLKLKTYMGIQVISQICGVSKKTVCSWQKDTKHIRLGHACIIQYLYLHMLRVMRGLIDVGRRVRSSIEASKKAKKRGDLTKIR